MSDMFNLEQVVEILTNMARDLEGAKELLTELDSAIGDGDLGITMSRGFRAVRDGLKGHPRDIGRIVMKAGMDFNDAAASTMGALLATAFMRAGKEVLGRTDLSLPDILRMAKAAEEGIRERGKAQVGDKTMLDAIMPAVMGLEEAVEEQVSVVTALERASAAAEQGVLCTIEMKSAIGRASWLGERTIGHQDPGATAVFLMLKSIVESAEGITESST